MTTARSKSNPKPTLQPETELQYLKGAGPHLAGALRNLNLRTVQDLLFHLPLRYEDRRKPVPLTALREQSDCLVRGQVRHAEVRFGGRRQLQVLIEDQGVHLLLRFFHFNHAQRASLATDAWVQAYGTVRFARGGFEMVHPSYQVASSIQSLKAEDGLTPVYPLTAGVTQVRLRKLIAQALELAATAPAMQARIEGLEAPNTLQALRSIHHPANDADADQLLRFAHPAQHRLLKEELLAHQLCMRMMRRRRRGDAAPGIAGLRKAQAELGKALPFQLTAAQQRVLDEIGQDLRGKQAMLRLIQGDVGSGKTVVAAIAMLATARKGYQAALMAPTELLVEQHQASLQNWLEPLGLQVERLSGRGRKVEREQRLARVASGAAQIVVGTHAMFQQSVEFRKLGLVVIDEQHRFGVQQRLELRDKGANGLRPHQLVMSATPIPRTLAQSMYADLDISVIDELPPGRTPVTTVVLNNERRDEVLSRIGQACRSGRQAYWVCTLIEDSEEIAAEAAEATAERLHQELPELRIGLVHGRLKSDEKDVRMRAFKAGECQLLVATTVIEVGVDVPQASIMVIENAERLGLAQLHQLRGRVGRGSTVSQCVLMYQAPLSRLARSRLQTMRETQDGFRIAEKDLELRGPGEILGRRQTGVVGLKLADPVRDAALVPPLQKLADRMLRDDAETAAMLIRRWVGDIERYSQV